MGNLAGPGVRVLLVGASHYENSTLPDLPSVIATVHDLADALHESCEVPRDQIRTLLDPHGIQELGDAVSRVAREAEDVLLVYYAGHGQLDGAGNLYLATRATQHPREELAHRAFEYENLRSLLRTCRADTIVVILDCCFSGNASAISPMPTDLEAPHSSGGCLLASAAPEELALAPEHMRHTAFGGVLIRLLREGDQSADEDWTLASISDAVGRQLREQNASRLHRVMTDNAGDLVLGRNATKTNPYPGLPPYSESGARFFFGRDDMTRRLGDRLADQLNDNGILVVVGPSGSGKSSLLSAGLIPRLREDTGVGRLTGVSGWPIRMFTPGTQPLWSLVTKAAGLTGDPADQLYATLVSDPTQLSTAIHEQLGNDQPDRRMILVVDQFEEVFSTDRDDESSAEKHEQRVAFVRALLSAGAAGSALVVLGLRADYYPRCTTQPWPSQSFENQLIVPVMNEDELREVIEKPAQKLDTQVAAELTERILRDLYVNTGTGRLVGAGVLPLLCYTLSELWRRRDGTRLSTSEYQRIGGVRQAINGSAEKCFSSLSEWDKRTARQILTSLVRLGEHGGEDTLRQRHLEDLPPGKSTEWVLREFTRQRLAIQGTDPITNQETVELAHVALTTAWDRFRGWLGQDRENKEAVQLLEDAAERWDRAGRGRDELLRGARLAAALELRGNGSVKLNDTTAAFLDASATEQRRITRLRHTTAAVLLTLLTLLAVAVLYGAEQAERERDQAVFARITSESDRLARSDGRAPADASLSTQLALTAYRLRRHTALGATMISRANESPLATQLTGRLDPFDTVAFSPDGQLLATVSQQHRIQLWRRSDQNQLELLGQTSLNHPDYVNSLAFSPDGRLLASTSVDESVQLWNIVEAAHPRLLHELRNASDPAEPALLNQPLVPGRVGLLAFSPDGRTLATVSRTDQSVRLWDITDPTNAVAIGVPLTGHQSYINALAFSPDGHTLASASADQTIRLWSTDNPAQPSQELDAEAGDVSAIAFSHDGRMLASGHDDRTIRLWNLTDPARAIPLGQPLTGHLNGIQALAFAPDDRTVTSVGAEGTMRVWHLPATVIIGHTGEINALAFSADGRTLASGGADRGVRLWDVTDSAHPVAHGTQGAGTSNEIGTMALAQDGHTFVTNAPGLRMWDWRISDPEDALHPPPSTEGGTLVFGPGGRVLAVAGTDQSLSLWRVTGPTEQVRLSRPLPGMRVSYVNAVGISHSGKLLVHASADRPLQLWDVADPTKPRPLGPAFAGAYDGYISAVAFNPDDRILATSTGLVIQLWDISDPTAPHPLGAPLLGHTGAIHTLAFAPDGRTLVSAGADQTIRRWDITDPTNATALGDPLIGHTGAIHALAFSPDGTLLASAGADHTIRLWQLDVAQTIRRVCATTSNVLTEDVWREYVSTDLPYRSACVP